MLADFVSEHPEIVRDVLEHPDGFDATTRSNRARRERIRTLIADLVHVLEHGTVEDRRHVPRIDGQDEFHERTLVRDDIVAKLEQAHLDAPDRELLLLSDWVWATEHERLAQRATQLAGLLDLSPDAAAIVSPDGQIRYVNRAAAQLLHAMTGLVGEQVIGKTGAELGFFVQAGPSLAEFRALAHAKSVSEVMVMGRWHELRVGEIHGPDGVVRSFALTLTDIHERKNSVVRLELLSRLSRLVGTVDRDELWTAMCQVPIPQLADWCAVSIIEDRRIHATFIAQRDPKRTKLRDELVVAASALNHHPLWRELAPTGFQLLSEVSEDLMRQLLDDDRLYELVAQVKVRSLMVIPVVSRGEPIAIMTFAYTDESRRRYGHDDPVVAVELALHAAHIAENARLVSEAKASELRFRVALADAHTIVYEQDESLRYLWNYGTDLPFSMVGKRHEDALPPDEASALTKLKQQVIDTGEPASAEIDLSFGGIKRTYRESIEAVRDRTGRPIGVIGAATDLTDQKRIQQELKNAVEVRDRVMGILGHDLRNPLTTMTMAAALLLERNDLPDDVKRRAATLERAARRMREMIDTLLDFTRVRATGKPLPITRHPCDLAEVAREMVDEVRAAYPDRSIEIELHGDTHGNCDGPRIAQALANLMSNAITYGDPARPVHVRVAGDPDMLTILVRNEGTPIPDWLLPVMFEPFSRGQPDIISPHGLGLGLFVVREIITSHGGTIDVLSTLEAGTSFTIHIPRSGMPTQPAP